MSQVDAANIKTMATKIPYIFKGVVENKCEEGGTYAWFRVHGKVNYCKQLLDQAVLQFMVGCFDRSMTSDYNAEKASDRVPFSLKEAPGW